MAGSVRNARKANTSGSNTCTTTSFDSVAGDTIWVGVSDASGQGSLTISDNNSNTYTQIGTTQTSGSGAQIRRYRAFNIGGRTGHTVTATWGSNSDATVHVLDLGGVSTSPLDVSAQTDDGNPPWTVTSPTLTQADSIAIALTGTAFNGTWSESSGFTIQTQEGNNTLYWTGAAASRVVNATTALTPSFTISGGGSDCAVSIDVFKASAGGGTVSATASQTLATVTQTATDTVTVAASATQTLAGVSQTATVQYGVHAAAAQTLATVTQAATATVTVAAAATQTLATVTQAATATTTVAATAAQTLAGVSQAATAAVTVSATAAQTLASVSQTATVQYGVHADAAQTLAGVTQAATATVTVSATAAQTLAGVAQTATVSVDNTVSGTATQTLAGVTQAATVAATVSAAATQTLAGVAQTATAAVTVSVPGAGVLPASRYLRMAITSWVFNGGINDTGLGDVRVQELQFFVGTTLYPVSPMSDNTTPSPLVASSSGALTGFGDLEPWNVFNHSTGGNQWQSSGNTPKYLQLDLGSGNAIAPTSVKVSPDNAVNVGGGYYITGFKILGSSTGAFSGEEFTYLTVTGLTQGDWTANTLKTFDVPIVLAQQLAGVSQSATVTADNTVSASAAQTLAGVTQAATTAVVVSASAAQTLAGVTQAATVSAPASLTATQTLDGVSQSATGTVELPPGFIAAQQLAGVSQTATTTVTVKHTASQTLAGVSSTATAIVLPVRSADASQVLDTLSQAATAQAIAKASGSQQLAGVAQAATAVAVDSIAASQTLAGVTQAATGTVFDTVHLVVAAQLLANVTQLATLAREYVYEENVRTWFVSGQNRTYGIDPQNRLIGIDPQQRAFAVSVQARGHETE